MPADGRLEQVKGRTYDLEELLGSDEEARAIPRRRAGDALPEPEHVPPRPLARGRARAGLDATSPAVSSRSTCPRCGRSIGLFVRNERVAIFLEADVFGAVALVMVGAANVGRMTLSFAPLVTNAGAAGGRRCGRREIRLRRGDELGAFNLGSTVVLLASDPRLEPLAAGRASSFV